MFGLSPEAQKAVDRAASRRCGWWPTLQRTTSHLIIRRPARARWQWSGWMAKNLPLFEHNVRRDWWQAPLSLPTFEAVQAHPDIRPSNGVLAWLETTAPRRLP